MHTSLLVTGLLFCICNAVPVVDDNSNKSKMKFRDILEEYTKVSTSENSVQREELFRNGPKNLTIVGFSWDNCGSADDAIQVKSLSLSPDPIVVPGKEKVAFDIVFATNVTKPTRLEMVVQKKMFGVFIKIPCTDNVGSCTYNDPCAIIAQFLKACPQPFIDNKIPCHCPFNAGEYTLPTSVISIPKLNIPSVLENGEYKLQATLYNGNTRLACYLIDASLKSA